MKIRNGFVSNSSSSSFCLYGIKIKFFDLFDIIYNLSYEKKKEFFKNSYFAETFTTDKEFKEYLVENYCYFSDILSAMDSYCPNHFQYDATYEEGFAYLGVNYDHKLSRHVGYDSCGSVIEYPYNLTRDQIAIEEREKSKEEVVNFLKILNFTQEDIDQVNFDLYFATYHS